MPDIANTEALQGEPDHGTALDIIDHLTGLHTDDRLDRLRSARPVTREQAQKSFDALFAPIESAAGAAGSVTLPERHAVAAFVAALHDQSKAADFHVYVLRGIFPAWVDPIREAATRGRAKGPYGHYPAGPLSSEDADGPVFEVSNAVRKQLGERLHAGLRHAHFLVFHPRDAHAERLRQLEAAGWSVGEIVTLSQLVAFLSFQLRVVAGLKVLAKSHEQQSSPGPERKGAHPSASPVELQAPGAAPVRFTQAELDWNPWIAPLAESELTERHLQGLVDASRGKSPYFRLLARDPDTLRARTLADKDIFYNVQAGLPRAERELAAAATSRHNGCIYCASVHARFASHFSHRRDDVQRLLDEGVGTDLGSRWNAIVDASVALTDTPPRLTDTHLAALRAEGLDELSLSDLIHAAAFFNWANRLMLSLGEPAYR